MRKGLIVTVAIALVLSFSLVPVAQALPDTAERTTTSQAGDRFPTFYSLLEWVESLFGAGRSEAGDEPTTAEGPGTEDRGELGPRIDPNGSSYR